MHKLFLSKPKYTILDFIEKNRDKVQYAMWEEPGKFFSHKAYIEAEGMKLTATLQRNIIYEPVYSIIASQITLSFDCIKKCDQNECMFNQMPLFINETCYTNKKAKFPLAVYNKMVNHYIQQHCEKKYAK